MVGTYMNLSADAEDAGEPMISVRKANTAVVTAFIGGSFLMWLSFYPGKGKELVVRTRDRKSDPRQS